MDVRRTRVVAVVALAVAVAITFATGGLAGGARAYGATTVLSVLSPEVLVGHAGAAFTTAHDGEIVRDGDTVRTLDGRAVLTYFEGSSVTLEPESELTVDETAVAADGGTVVLMTQTLGRTWHVVTKLITGGSRYEVRTPASTASVRGTKFSVDVDGEATTVTTTEGIVMQHVDDPVRPGIVAAVAVAAGMTQRQTRGATPSSAKPRPAAPAAPRTVEPRKPHSTAPGRTPTAAPLNPRSPATPVEATEPVRPARGEPRPVLVRAAARHRPPR